MDGLVAGFNIERFRETLAVEPDETKWQTLLGLLAEDDAKLATTRTVSCKYLQGWPSELRGLREADRVGSFRGMRLARFHLLRCVTR